MKKVIAFMLAVVMALGLCSMASATAPNDRVQVNNMMVDASLVETETNAPVLCNVEKVERDLYLENARDVAQFATTSTVNYPPIAEILLGSNSSINVTDDGTDVQYVLHVPGGSTTGTQNFVFKASESTTYSNLLVTYNGQDTTLTSGQSNTIAMTLSNGAVEFDVSWLNSANVSCTQHCVLTIDTSTSVAIYENETDVGVYVTNISGSTASLDSSSVGGVTRYTCAITLPANSDNTNVNVQFKLVSSGASATLGGVTPNSEEVNADHTKIVTFNGVDFSNAKNLVITNGSTSRTYVVSAVVEGSTVTVYFAIRTYLANQWLNGDATYYDYASNGFGSGDDLSDAEWDEADAACSGIAAWNTPNAPESIDATTNRPIFAQNSYVAIEMDADAKVMDVLTTFISQHSGLTQTGASNNYVSEIAFNGNALGEFTCGQGSGWMYMARSSRTDVTTALPNAGAASWAISNGMYIDWYYTAAYGMDFGYSMFDM